MTDAATLFETIDGVGVITLNRPDKFNCLSSEVLDGFDAALNRISTDDTVRAVLLKSTGKNFCTGADLQEVKTARQDKALLRTFIERGHRVLRRFEQLDLPVIGAVQGLALAGGLEMVLVCDVVFAADTAKIGDQHAQFGLVPGFGGTQRLARVVGVHRALDLMFSARWLSAPEAFACGLVNHVVEAEDLHEQALSYCASLARKNPEGLAAMKRITRAGLELKLDDGLALEREGIVDILRTKNVAEGLAAFAERRVPSFGSFDR